MRDRGAMYEPPTGVTGSSGKDGRCRVARVQGVCVQSEKQNGLILALKQGNVATFGATSRRYRED